MDYNGFKIQVSPNHCNDNVRVRVSRKQEIVDDFELNASVKQAFLFAELLIDKGCYSQGQTTLDNVF